MRKRFATPGFSDASLPGTLSPEIRPLAPAASLAGHRERLRARLLSAGPDALADHELIEIALFLALPRRDTKGIARVLIVRFGSFAAAIAAPVPDLLAVDGLGEAGVAALKTVHAAAQRLAKAEVLYRPILSNWDRLMEYLQAVLARERVRRKPKAR
jgi:DNA repair protein RadC